MLISHFLGNKIEAASNSVASMAPSQVYERFKLRIGTYAGEIDGDIQVSIISASGLLNKDGGSNESDPYVTILLDDEVIGTTTVKSGVKHVVWKEFFEKSSKGKYKLLTLRVLDKDLRSSTFLGEVRIAFKDLKNQRIIKGPTPLEKRLIKAGETAVADDFNVAGTLDYIVRYRPKTLDGHLKIHIDKATGVKSEDMGGLGDPYVCVLLDSQEIGQTRVKNNTVDPVYNETFDVDVSGSYEALFLTVWDSDVGSDDYISHLKIPTSELVEKKNISATSNLLRHSSDNADPVPLGTLTYTLTWTLPDFSGKVDLKILKATDLLEADPGIFRGSSDPFVEVLLDNVSVGKTKTITNNLNPVWNETISFETKGQHQKLQLVVWDADLMKNDPLGGLRLPINEIIKNKAIAGEFILAPYGKAPGAGSLSFELVFHPK